MNAELDATIGPILNVHAQRAGVIMSACDGDEPGLQMNLVRWVQGLGLTPRVIGNVKGLQDPYRNPDTQRGFAEKWGQNPAMVTSFADGSKISFEQTIVANATGFKVLQRGMSRGVKFDGSPLELPSLYDVDEVRELGGIIDYTVGPSNVKIFVPRRARRPQAAALPEPLQAGRRAAVPVLGPVPPAPLRDAQRDRARRLCSATTLAEAARRPRRWRSARSPSATSRPGEVLDDYGMFMTYGEAVNAEEMCAARLLPEGLVEGCTPAPRHRPGRGPDLRRRRASRGPRRRPAARRAVPPLPRRDLARGAPARPRPDASGLDGRLCACPSRLGSSFSKAGPPSSSSVPALADARLSSRIGSGPA